MSALERPTVEEFWCQEHGDSVRWRVARRKEHECGRCSRVIRIGERYLDTAELVDPPWTTAKVCESCAKETVS